MKLTKLGICGIISLLSYTALVVAFSVGALVFIMIGSKKEGMKSLLIWSCICLAAMLLGKIGSEFH